MESEILHYNAILGLNREVFLLKYGQEFQAFEDSDVRLQKIAELISKKRNDQNESIVGLLPFLLIILRQARNAFECLSRYKSYESWIVFRPALESTLTIGKFLDNPSNADLWRNRRQICENRKKDKEKYERYKKEFEGDGLIPNSLPQGKEFRQLLSRINDEFMHMNYDYFKRNLTVSKIGTKGVLVKVSFTDDDPHEHEACLLSFLHMYRLLIRSLGQAFASKYRREGDILNIEVESIERIWGPKIVELVQKISSLKEFCKIFGLWKF